MYARLILVIAAVLALAGTWWHGYKRGEAHDRQRSDLVIAKMVSDAQARLDAANAQIRQQAEQMQATKEGAERDLQAERQRQARRVADAVATDRLMRDQLAEVARGPGPAADTIAACRSDASALGDVLGGVLSDLATCTAAAEQEAAGARALLAAWPRTETLTKEPKP